MKIKSHKFSRATALCAVAVFSISMLRDAQARILPDADPGPVTMPIPSTDVTSPRYGIQPLPAITPPSDSPVPNGTFVGTVVAD